MSDSEEGDYLFDLKIPLWQVLFGVVAAFAVKYFIVDTSHRKKHHQQHNNNNNSNNNKSKSPDDLSSPSSPKTGGVSSTVAPIAASADSNTKEQEIAIETKLESTTAPAPAPHESDEDDPFDPAYLFFDEPYPIEDNYTIKDGPYKMILVVNNELKMGKGKIAAQCGHATLGAYKLSKKFCKTALSCWERHGVAKVALRVEKEEEMYELYETAKAIGIVAYIVEDAGRTQIAAGSRTVLALGPAPVMIVDQITGHLKLL